MLQVDLFAQEWSLLLRVGICSALTSLSSMNQTQIKLNNTWFNLFQKKSRPAVVNCSLIFFYFFPVATEKVKKWTVNRPTVHVLIISLDLECSDINQSSHLCIWKDTKFFYWACPSAWHIQHQGICFDPPKMLNFSWQP